MTSSEKLLQDVEAFISENDLTATRFGIMALNDGKFVFHLRGGRSPSLETLDRLNAFMDSFEKAA